MATKLAFPLGTIPGSAFEIGSYRGKSDYYGANEKTFFTHTPGHKISSALLAWAGQLRAVCRPRRSPQALLRRGDAGCLFAELLLAHVFRHGIPGTPMSMTGHRNNDKSPPRHVAVAFAWMPISDR
jgi:hypothetical protein